MQEKYILEVIEQFMMRVDLKGSEVPAFNACMQYLEAGIEKEKVKDVD